MQPVGTTRRSCGTALGKRFAYAALVADVAAMLGHDPVALLRTYASAAVKGQRAAADALGSVLGDASEEA